MMVQDDHIDSALVEPRNGFQRCRTAVHRQEQPDGKLFQAVFDAVAAQAVAFIQPTRQVVVCAPAKPEREDSSNAGIPH